MNASTSNCAKSATEIPRTPVQKKLHCVQTKLAISPSMADVIVPWSPRKQSDLKSELERLKEAFKQEIPLCEIPLKIHHNPINLIPKKLIGQYIEGQKLTLSELSEGLKRALFGDSEAPGHDLKVTILDIASRKYYGPKDSTRKMEVDPFEDKTKMPFWFWETRSMSVIHEELRTRASKLRQKHKHMRDRVHALDGVLKLIGDDQQIRVRRNIHNKLKAALERLDLVPDSSIILNGTPSGDEAGSFKRVRKRMKRESDVACVLSYSKTKHDEAKLATASGFGTIKSLRNAQTIFKSFVETPTKKQTQLSEFTFAGHESVSCPEEKRLVYKIGDVEFIDQQLRKNWNREEILQEFYETQQRLSEDLDRFKSIIYGAPPTWARKPLFEFSYQQEIEKLFGLECNKEDVVTVRKKYLWFNSDSNCPPYYGPFQSVDGVTSRAPFRRVVDLDYDEIFDEGWELDPEGESLSGDEDEDDEKQCVSDEDEEDDPFIVEDGYLSEDEGLGAEMDVEDDLSISSESGVSTNDKVSKMILNDSKIDSLVKKSIKSGQLCTVSAIPNDHGTVNVNLLLSLQGFRIGRGKVSIGKKK